MCMDSTIPRNKLAEILVRIAEMEKSSTGCKLL